MDEYLSFFYIGDLVINVYLFGFCIFLYLYLYEVLNEIRDDCRDIIV